MSFLWAKRTDKATVAARHAKSTFKSALSLGLHFIRTDINHDITVDSETLSLTAAHISTM